MDDVIYNAPAGRPIQFGLGSGPSPEFPWANSLVSNRWTQISSEQKFYDWAIGPNGINIPGARGTNPINSIVNAYCDPAIDLESGDEYYYGGGHGDGSNNSICLNRASDLTWHQVDPGTPSSVYMPLYMNTTNPIFYPGGSQFSVRPHELGTYFLTVNEGLDPVTDAGYIAPKLSRASTHMYQGGVYRNKGGKKELHYMYNGYGKYDLNTNQWSGHNINLEEQLAQFKRVNGVWKIPVPPETGDGATLASSNKVWGVSAVYDKVTDRVYFLVTGGGYRNHIAQFNCDTGLIESVHVMTGFTAQNASFFCIANRKLYVFGNEGSVPRYNANRGFIFDMDSKAVVRFDTAGDIAPQIATNIGQETIPGWYDSNRNRICRMNYSVSISTIYVLNLTPVSGAGTHADPFILNQVAKTVTIDGGAFPDSAGPPIMYVYGRMVFIPGADCVKFIPRSDSGSHNTGKHWALKLGD